MGYTMGKLSTRRRVKAQVVTFTPFCLSHLLKFTSVMCHITQVTTREEGAGPGGHAGVGVATQRQHLPEAGPLRPGKQRLPAAYMVLRAYISISC